MGDAFCLTTRIGRTRGVSYNAAERGCGALPIGTSSTAQLTVGRLMEELNRRTGEAVLQQTNSHMRLDRFKRLAAAAIVARCDISLIRSHSLANLDRWIASGTWVSAFDEWRQLLTRGTDEQIQAVMTGSDEYANRLRQSPPYTGLLPEDVRNALLVESDCIQASSIREP